MVVIMKPGATAAQIGAVIAKAEKLGCQTHPIYGEARTVVALVGDLTQITREPFDALDGVAKTVRIQEPYKLSSRSARPENTIIELANGQVVFGGPEVIVMAGPCSVESRQQIIVGVNEFVVPEEHRPRLLRVDPAVGERQRARLEALRARRDNERVGHLLADLVGADEV